MKTNSKVDITINKLKEDLGKINWQEVKKQQQSYFSAYTEFLNYFQKLPIIDHHSFIIGSHFVYGWMPTILNIESSHIDMAIGILNKAKQNEKLNSDELENLKRCINNSLVGTSKFLHFMNPKLYSIWDRRVCRYFINSEPYEKVSSVNLYLSYLSLCTTLQSQENYNFIHKVVEENVGYSIMPNRAIELIMFLNGAKKKSHKNLSASIQSIGEGNPILEESEDARKYGRYQAYLNLTNDLNFSPKEALSIMHITESEVKELLREYSD